MRRVLTTFAAAAALAASSVLPVGADPGPGGFRSPNVSWVANIPIDSPGVGARVVTIGDQIRLYVTGVKGLTIYDVTNPALPVPIGATALPNWENEDVEVSADGRTVIVANDVFDVSYLIDATDPRAPILKGLIPGGEHTITCADRTCKWAYGRSGAIFDLRDRAAPKLLDHTWFPAKVKLTQRVHDIFRDETGLLFTDTLPRMILDPRRDPTRPKLIAAGAAPAAARVAYQHNSVRPGAKEWRARKRGDNGRALRAGEILLANGETNFFPQCDGGSGPFSTWSIKDFDKGVAPKVLDVFRPVNGTWADGNPAANVGLGCSGHWFTERNGIVAAAWYEHGTRFLKVAPTTGKITEVGFFQPVVGSASAAHWVGDSHIYTIDYERGIDILRFERTAAKAATQGQIEASWRAVRRPSVSADAERYACRMATEAR